MADINSQFYELFLGSDMSGGSVEFFEANTLTPTNVWVDEDKSSAVNTITADTRGVISFYGDNTYRLRVKDSDGNLLYDWPEFRIKPIEEFASEVTASSYASLDAAVAAIGSTETTLVIDTAMSQVGNVIVPSNIQLLFKRNGSIDQVANTLTINGDIDTGTFQIFNGTGDVYIDTDVVNPKWWGAKGDNITDDTTAIQAALTSVRNRNTGSVLFNKGSYIFSSTLEIDIPINFGGNGPTGGRWNRISGNKNDVRLIWNGGVSNPALLLGGTVGTPFAWNLEGVRLHDFILIPNEVKDADAPGTTLGGQDGILIDGSQARNANRLNTEDVIFDHVVVRQFTRNNYRFEGNVFDVRLNECVSTLSGSDGFLTVNVVSSGSDSPGQIRFTNCYMNSSFVDTWAIDTSASSDISFIGGGISGAGDGIKLLSYSKIYGTHFEGDAGANAKIGIQIIGQGNSLTPGLLGGYTTLLKIGDGGSESATDWNFNGGIMAFGTTALHITAGGARRGVYTRPHYTNVTNNIVNDRLTTDDIYELVHLNALDRTITTLPSGTTPSLLVNGDFRRLYQSASNGAITNFTNGYSGQEFILQLVGSGTDFTNNTTLQLAGNISWTTSKAGDNITFFNRSGVWYETSRSVN